jgi:hypothetical protein
LPCLKSQYWADANGYGLKALFWKYSPSTILKSPGNIRGQYKTENYANIYVEETLAESLPMK